MIPLRGNRLRSQNLCKELCQMCRASFDIQQALKQLFTGSIFPSVSNNPLNRLALLLLLEMFGHYFMGVIRLMISKPRAVCPSCFKSSMALQSHCEARRTLSCSHSRRACRRALSAIFH